MIILNDYQTLCSELLNITHLMGGQPMRNLLNSTNFKQIIVGNSGLGHPPPDVYVPIIISFIIEILTDPPPSQDIQDIDWLGLSASVLAGEGFPQPGPERPK